MAELPASISVLMEIGEITLSVQEIYGRERARLSPTESSLLLHLDQPHRMGELAGFLHCQPSNLTAIVDKLEGAGLLERRRSATDRRAIEIALTRKGGALRRRMIARITAVIAHVSGLSETDYGKILDVLRTARGAAASGKD